MNRDDVTAATLNTAVTVRIAPSKIHGVGVFALRDLPAGKKLHLDAVPQVYQLAVGSLSKLYPEVRQIIVDRWPRIFSGSAIAYPDARYQAYVNHSDDYNYDCISDTLIEDVKAGDEITENYRSIPGWQDAHPWLTNNDVV
jgi:hypothetical protein